MKRTHDTVDLTASGPDDTLPEDADDTAPATVVPVAAVAGLSPTLTRNLFIRRQRPFDFVQRLVAQGKPPSVHRLFAMSANLLQAGQPGGELRRLLRDGADAMTMSAERVLGESVDLTDPFDLTPKGGGKSQHQMNTTTAPFVFKGKLRRGHRPDALRAMVDASPRIVVKMNDVDAAVPTSDTGGHWRLGFGADDWHDMADVMPLLAELVILSTFLNLLRGRDHVVTPHFVRLVDAFYGPRLVSHQTDPATLRPDLLFDATRVAQYTILERADFGLYAMLEPSLVHSTLLANCPVTARHVVVVVMQALLALEAAWETGGFMHYDLHAGNFMVRRVVNPAVATKTWVYMRRALPGRTAAYFAIRPEVHNGWFASLIDFGRSRAWCHADAAGGGERALVGDPTNVEIGCPVNVPDARIDRSADVRNLGLDMLFRTQPILNQQQQGVPPLSSVFVRRYKHMLVCASNAYHVFGRQRALEVLAPTRIAGTTWPSDSAKEACAFLVSPGHADAYRLFWADLVKRVTPVVQANVAADYVPDEAEAVRLFDALHAALAATTSAIQRYFATAVRFLFANTSPASGYNQGNRAVTPSTLLNLRIFLETGSRGSFDVIGAPALHAMLMDKRALVLGRVDESDLWRQPVDEDPNATTSSVSLEADEEEEAAAMMVDEAVEADVVAEANFRAVACENARFVTQRFFAATSVSHVF